MALFLIDSKIGSINVLGIARRATSRYAIDCVARIAVFSFDTELLGQS